MKNIFKNLGYAIATMVASFALLAALPGSIGVFQVAQATPTPCPGSADIEVEILTWNASTINYTVRTIVDIGSEPSATVKLYAVSSDNTNGSLEDEVVITSDDSFVTFANGHFGIGFGKNPVKFRVVVTRAGCADIVTTVSFPKPTDGPGSLAFAEIENVTVEDYGSEDVLALEPVISYDSGEHNGLVYEVKYRDDNTPWENISPSTPDNPASEYDIKDYQKLSMDRNEIELVVPTADHGDHEVLVRIMDPNTSPPTQHFQSVVSFD